MNDPAFCRLTFDTEGKVTLAAMDLSRMLRAAAKHPNSADAMSRSISRAVDIAAQTGGAWLETDLVSMAPGAAP